MLVVVAVLAVALRPRNVAQAAPAPPRSETSHYMKTVNPTTLYTMGCTMGKRDLGLEGAQDSLVIFHFGMPRARSGQYSTSIYTANFASTAQIRAAVQQHRHHVARPARR